MIYMRHQKSKISKFKSTAHKKSLASNLAESLILYEKITTTKTKAKAIKSVVDKLITIAKKNNLAARRELLKRLHTKNAVKKLMEVLGPRYTERRGGYSRVTLVSGNRVGDAADKAVVELI